MRKKGKYYYARFYDKDRTPKRKEVSLRITRKSSARKELNRLEREYEAGDYDPWMEGAPKKPLSVSGAISQFLAEKKRSVRQSTHDTYTQQLEAWEQQLPPQLMLQHVSTEHVRPYLFQSGTSNATKRKRYRHLRAFFNWAEDEGHVDVSALADVDPPKKEKKSPSFLTPGQLENVLNTISEHAEATTDAVGRTPDVQWLRDAIQIAVCTGLRRSELVNLRWADIDLESGMLTVRNRDGFTSKSGHERSVPIRGDATEVLQRRREQREEGSSHVLTDRNGDPLKPDRLTKRFKFFVREADLENKERLNFHSLRHTTGSWLSMQGVSLRIIQAILGHSSASVTEKYSHLQPEVMGRALEETFGG